LRRSRVESWFWSHLPCWSARVSPGWPTRSAINSTKT